MDASRLEQLRRYIRESVQDNRMDRKAAASLMEIIDQHETFRPEPVQKHKASNRNSRDAPKKRSKIGSR